MSTSTDGLTVAVTGPTGTFGFGLVPLLEHDDRIGRVVGIARRPFDPADHGWTKMTYRQGDVRAPEALAAAFRDVDVVVHLAFLITGTAGIDATRRVNVDGTVNTFRAAADAGATRFVYASSVAAYGFFADTPLGITEEWPLRPATRLFYAREKAELEGLLRDEAAVHPDIDLYVLRPPIVLGPHAVGAKSPIPTVLQPIVHGVASAISRLPLKVPVPVPAFPMQFIHEDDVGRALLLCVLGAGPPGAYNIAGDGTVTAWDVAEELGLLPVPFPLGVAQRIAQAATAVPTPSFVPPATEWLEAATYPVIMDTSRARRELGWTPRYSALEALRDTLPPAPPR